MFSPIKRLSYICRTGLGALALCACLSGTTAAAANVLPPDSMTASRGHPPDPALFYGKSRLNALTFKVNAVGAAMLVTNATFELEFSRWSAQLPVYFSGLDYFSHQTKFRIMALQPGIRYWFRPESDTGHTGWFAGAHLGMAWYNFALSGGDRIQDHNGRTPALGGGIEAGWRTTLGKTGRWKLELAIGAGAYKARYDHIDNSGAGTVKSYRNKTFFGIDHVGVTFGYSLDLKKKKKGGSAHE